MFKLRSPKSDSRHSEHDDIEEAKLADIEYLYELLNELKGIAKSSSRPAEEEKPTLKTRQVRANVTDENGHTSLKPIPLKNVSKGLSSRYSLDDSLMQSAHNDRQIPDAYTVRNF